MTSGTFSPAATPGGTNSVMSARPRSDGLLNVTGSSPSCRNRGSATSVVGNLDMLFRCCPRPPPSPPFSGEKAGKREDASFHEQNVLRVLPRQHVLERLRQLFQRVDARHHLVQLQLP